MNRTDWICVGVLMAVTLTIFWQGWYDPADMVREDAAYLLQPYYQFAADEVRSGRFPHWNPYAMCGLPFHAVLQGAVLYPLRWPLFWLSWPVGYALSLWVHYFLAGALMFLFIRLTFRCRPLPALIGAMSFAFGGFTLGHLTHPNYYLSYPWFVLTILLLTQAVERRRWTWAIAAGLPVALMGLAGSVHLLLILGFGLGVWSVGEPTAAIARRLRSGKPGWRDALRPAAVTGIALALGGLLAAVQILPAHLQMTLSTRTETDYRFITEISAHPIRTLIRLVVPFYWGNYRLGYWGENLFHEQCFYTGIVPLIAAVVAVAVCPRDRWVIRLIVLCAVTVAVAAGRYLPFYWVLYHLVPMFNRLRDPARLLWWLQFGIACLAAIGLDSLHPPNTSTVRRRGVLTSVLTGAGVMVLLLGCLVRLAMLVGDPSAAVEFVQRLDHLSQTERAVHLAAAHRMPAMVMQQGDPVTWIGIAAAALSCAVLSGALAFHKRLTRRTGSLLVLLLVLDLGMLSAGMLNYTDEKRIVQTTPPHARFLQENLGLARYVCLRNASDEVSLHRGMLFRIRHAIAGGGGIFHTPRQERMIGLLWRGNLRLASLAGVRYLVMDRPIDNAPLRCVFRNGRQCINENTAALPRAFLARQVRWYENPDEMLEEILTGHSDLSDVAFVERPVDPLGPPGPADRERGRVSDIQTEPTWFRMRTQAPGPRQLVLTETYHPEWRCRIDGQEVPIHPTHWTFMSVRVPPGEHQVEWRFESTRFRAGLIITCITLASVVAALVSSRFIGRRAATTRPFTPPAQPSR